MTWPKFKENQIIISADPKLPSTFKVVIDVIRAFTTTQIIFAKNARDILLVMHPEEGIELSQGHPNCLLVGEHLGYQLDGYHHGNSPGIIDEYEDLTDQRIILRTTNGVKLTLLADHYEELLVTGFSNSVATIRYLAKQMKPDHTLQLIPSDSEGDEDWSCAEFIKNSLLAGNFAEHEPYVKRILNCNSAQKFLNESRPEFPKSDLEYCVKIIDTGFVMCVHRVPFPHIVKEEL